MGRSSRSGPRDCHAEETAGRDQGGELELIKFKTLLADPAWPEYGGGRIKRGADKHYPLLAIEDIAPTILASGLCDPADDSHLYLWATNNHLMAAGDVIKALGFRYVTCVTWAKNRFGPGQYFRGQTEHLLFAVRGAGLLLRREWTDRKDLSTLIAAPHRYDASGTIIHSAKPDESYEQIELASPPPRIDFFARRRRPGWHQWGNEM